MLRKIAFTADIYIENFEFIRLATVFLYCKYIVYLYVSILIYFIIGKY
jgi:hypothetical protein